MSCVWWLHSGHCGIVCVEGSILCRYDLRNGDLLVRSCDSVLLVLWESVCSVSSICGGAVSSILLWAVDMCPCTICVCMFLRFCLMVVDVVFWGAVSRLIV